VPPSRCAPSASSWPAAEPAGQLRVLLVDVVDLLAQVGGPDRDTGAREFLVVVDDVFVQREDVHADPFVHSWSAAIDAKPNSTTRVLPERENAIARPPGSGG
jgi:hypothetical protein